MTKAIGFLNLHDDLDLGPLTTNRSIASTSFLGRCFDGFPNVKLFKFGN